MNLEEAIKTALEYEIRIRDLYIEAAGATQDPTGIRIFRDLAADEQNHVLYLQAKLDQWRREGTIDVDRLETAIPDSARIQAESAKLQAKARGADRGIKQRMLTKALQMEIETSRFYREMVDLLSGEGRTMFARFLEIEDNHIEVVQFELDHVSHTGLWFGFEEFDMEAE